MKKLASALVFAALSFSFVSVALAADAPASEGGEPGEAFVYVTEKIPGANCEPAQGRNEQDLTKRLYKCPVGKGFGTITSLFGSLIKYATYVTGLVAVLMIVLSGIQYSMSGGGEDAKKAKGRVMQLIAGLALLFLTGFILNTVAPWIYK